MRGRIYAETRPGCQGRRMLLHLIRKQSASEARGKTVRLNRRRKIASGTSFASASRSRVLNVKKVLLKIVGHARASGRVDAQKANILSSPPRATPRLDIASPSFPSASDRSRGRKSTRRNDGYARILWLIMRDPSAFTGSNRRESRSRPASIDSARFAGLIRPRNFKGSWPSHHQPLRDRAIYEG